MTSAEQMVMIDRLVVMGKNDSEVVEKKPVPTRWVASRG